VTTWSTKRLRRIEFGVAVILLFVGGTVKWWCLVPGVPTFVGKEVAPIFIGVGTTLGIGLFAGCFVNMVTVGPEWLKLNGRHAPEVLGLLERLFFFAAIWLKESSGIGAFGIGAWLTIKLATKWKAFSLVEQLPEDFGGNTDGERVHTRVECAAYLNNRFLIGTLYNVLCGIAGAAAGWLVGRLRDGGLAL